MSVLRRLMILATPVLVAACNPAETVANEKDSKPSEQAATQAVVSFDEAKLKARFEQMGVDVISLNAASINGLVEVETSGGVVFSTPTGDQFIAGTLYSLDADGTYVDVLAERQAPLNAAKIEEFKQDMIIYPAENEKYVITVFTDITCGYCVRLNNQMQGYNQLGITVRYLAYPRQGPTGDVAEAMARIWCSENPNSAMTEAKQGGAFNGKADNLEQCSKKVMEQYMLGRDLGITGTPAVFLPNGKLVAGYMPPAGLFQRIEQEMTK